VSLRLVEIVLPENYEGEVSEVLERLDILGHWEQKLDSGMTLARVLVESADVESVVEEIQARFSVGDNFRAMLLEVEATVPVPQDDEEDTQKKEPERVAVMELVEKLSSGSRLTRTYVATLVLSTVVAAAGLVRGNVAVVIGAMVIAPLLSPNMALSLATTLGDMRLAARSALTFAAGGVMSFLLAVLAAVVVHVDPTVSELSSRAAVGMGDIALALAAGSAGALAFTTGVSASLVGVMVAVALLPPLVAAGLLFGTGESAMAWRALLLFATNVICVNLAGVFTFLAQGVRPRLRWEEARAPRMLSVAVALWGALLAVLAVLIWLVQRS